MYVGLQKNSVIPVCVIRGTFLGITEKAEYFKELGINQIKADAGL